MGILLLTVKQEKACVEFMKHGDKTKAYRSAYNCERMKPATVNRCAFQLFENNKLTARIKELSQKVEKQSIMSIVELQEFWSETTKKEKEDMRNRLKASDLLGKSKAAFTENVNLSGTLTLADLVLKRKKEKRGQR